jgi:hypothetical protein
MSRIFIDASKKAVIDAELTTKAADEWFAEQVEAGFTTTSGIKLGLKESDVTLLTGNYVLAKEAAALGMQLPALIDADGQSHTMTDIEELTAIMLAYGQHRAALSAEYANRKNDIQE